MDDSEVEPCIMTEIKRFDFFSHEIFGICHVPAQAIGKTGVILFCPGHQYRVGPHRMYVKLARLLEQNGFHVLHVDSEDIGDSTGGFDCQYLHEVHGLIQRGKFVRTARRIIQTFKKEYGLENIVVSGLCGGSLTGLLAARKCGDVDAILAFGLPLVYSDVSGHIFATNAEGATRKAAGGSSSSPISFFEKVRKPDLWKKILTGQINIPSKLKLLRQEVEKKLLKRNPVINYKVVKVLVYFLNSGRKIRLIFSENDFHLKNFFAVVDSIPDLKKSLTQTPGCISIIKGANHIISLPEWEQEFHKIFLFTLRSWFYQTYYQGHKIDDKRG